MGVSENLVFEKNVLVSVSENLASKKVSVSVSENLVSEKRLGLGVGEIGLRKKYRFWKVWSKKSLSFCFGKLVLRKEKLEIAREKLDQVNSANLLFEF